MTVGEREGVVGGVVGGMRQCALLSKTHLWQWQPLDMLPAAVERSICIYVMGSCTLYQYASVCQVMPVLL